MGVWDLSLSFNKNIKIHEVGENYSCCWLHSDTPISIAGLVGSQDTLFIGCTIKEIIQSQECLYLLCMNLIEQVTPQVLIA